MNAQAQPPQPLLSYDEWVSYVFDNPVASDGLAWYWNNDDWDPLSAPEAVTGYLTTALTNIATVAAPYSDAQIAQTLEYLVSNACSSHMFVLLEDRVPLEARLACVRAFFAVHRDLFAPRCSPYLGHLRTGANAYPTGANPLDTVCYMWWDIYPIGGRPADSSGDALNRAALWVMAQTLTLPSDACREGAIHGLGHWMQYYPDDVIATIDAFLARTPDLRPELRRYALSARAGCVL
jgi:hypothetical protein